MILACPRCRTAMRAQSFKGVLVESCGRCHGIWFDVGELAHAARVALPPVSARGESGRRCPHCRTSMWHDRMGPVIIERCKQCNGVFLERGEFRTLRRGKDPVGGRRPVDWRREGSEAGEVAMAAAELALWTVLITLGD